MISRKNKTTKGTIIIVISMAVLIGFVTSVISLSQQTAGQEPSKEIKSINQKFSTDLDFVICGGDKDPKITGSPENPILLKKGTGISIPICITNIDVMPRGWEIKAEDAYLPRDPLYGIHVDFSKTYLDLPARVGTASHYRDGKNNVPDFIATVTADPNAVTGVHNFMIQARYPTENGTFIIGNVYYVDIEK